MSKVYKVYLEDPAEIRHESVVRTTTEPDYAAILGMLLCANDHPVTINGRTYATGCVLFTCAETKRVIRWFGLWRRRPLWRVTYIFWCRSRPWGNFLLGGSWVTARDAKGVPLYPPAPLHTLIAGDR